MFTFILWHASLTCSVPQPDVHFVQSFEMFAVSHDCTRLFIVSLKNINLALWVLLARTVICHKRAVWQGENRWAEYMFWDKGSHGDGRGVKTCFRYFVIVSVGKILSATRNVPHYIEDTPFEFATSDVHPKTNWDVWG